MRFQKKKITQEVRGILGKYLDGTEKNFGKQLKGLLI